MGKHDKTDEIKKAVNEEKNEVSELQEQYNELDDRYKRLLAEFENFKKRNTKEKYEIYENAKIAIVERLLPAIDSLEKANDTNTKDEEFKKGMELVYKQFIDFLNDIDVEIIKTIGEMFDPELHEAIHTEKGKAEDEGKIIKEFRKGYKLGSKVIRHAMVIVSK